MKVSEECNRILSSSSVFQTARLYSVRTQVSISIFPKQVQASSFPQAPRLETRKLRQCMIGLSKVTGKLHMLNCSIAPKSQVECMQQKSPCRKIDFMLPHDSLQDMDMRVCLHPPRIMPNPVREWLVPPTDTSTQTEGRKAEQQRGEKAQR